jgi:tRNA1Val (adenine37-N6)-methyltransferase
MRKDDMGFGGLVIFQEADRFCYGVDAVILADFAARIRSDASSAADLGAGNGAVSLILSHKMEKAGIKAIEIQKEMAALAQKSVEANGLEERIEVIEADVRDIVHDENYRECVDVAVCNPPYIPEKECLISPNPGKAIARHEIKGKLKDFLEAAFYMLKDKGDLFMIHRPSRLVDIISYARDTGLEAKTLRPVAAEKDEDSNLVLIHFRKGAGKELKLMRPLYIYENGRYTDELLSIYER